MNSKYFVPFETAKQLKEKGYPSTFIDMYYDCNQGSLIPAEVVYHDYTNEPVVAAPTYHEVVDFLEEKNEMLSIEILCGINPFTKQRYYYGKVFIGEPCEPTVQDGMRVDIKCKEYRCDGKSREEALNAAILKALEMI